MITFRIQLSLFVTCACTHTRYPTMASYFYTKVRVPDLSYVSTGIHWPRRSRNRGLISWSYNPQNQLPASFPIEGVTLSSSCRRLKDGSNTSFVQKHAYTVQPVSHHSKITCRRKARLWNPSVRDLQMKDTSPLRTPALVPQESITVLLNLRNKDICLLLRTTSAVTRGSCLGVGSWCTRARRRWQGAR